MHAILTLYRLKCVALMAILVPGCVCKDVPKEQKLADCTNSTLRFQMVVEDFPPYQFVLGLPTGSTGTGSFRGEVVVRQGTGTVARVPISSYALVPCNT